MEGEPVGSENYGSETTATGRQRSSPLTANRMVNLLLMVSYGVSIVLNMVCLVVMVIKHKELVDKFGSNNQGDEELCVLFMNKEGQTLKFTNNKCHLVIYGSAALAGCAFLMMVFLLIRTLLFRK